MSKFGLKGTPTRTFTKTDKGTIGAFSAEIDAAFVEMMGGVKAAVIQLATDALASVVTKSPVDTGQFYNNWIVSIGQPSAAEAIWTKAEKDAKAGPNIGKDNITTLAEYNGGGDDGLGPWPMFILQNNVPYALALEYGHSMKAPLGMVELTLIEMAGEWDSTTL